MIRRSREPDAVGLTHLGGVFLAVVALVIPLTLASRVGSPRATVVLTIPGLSLIALCSASAFHRILPLGPRRITRTLRIDQMMIVVPIAGTYNPFFLPALHGGWP